MILIILPLRETLPINILSSCLDDVKNSYKYYWFLAIIEHLNETGEKSILLKDLAFRMISNVWYPLDYYKLSFGKQDGFKNISNFLSSKIEFDHTPKSPSLYNQINNSLSRNEVQILYNEIYKLIRYVPYRFLRPFFKNELRRID